TGKRIERVVAGRDVARGHERFGDLRTPDAPPAGRGLEDWSDVDGTPQRGETAAHLAHAPQTVLALAIQKCAQRGRGGVEEVPEDVHVAAVGDGADLDARDELEAGRAGGVVRRVAAGCRVVIGDADGRKARSAGLVDELRRRQEAVGGGRVEVKIYQRPEADVRR